MFLTNHSSAFLLHDVRVVKNVACLSSLMHATTIPLATICRLQDFDHTRAMGISYQCIRTKVDKILNTNSMLKPIAILIKDEFTTEQSNNSKLAIVYNTI